MAANYSYINVNQKNISDFEEWVPQFTPMDASSGEYAFGILRNEKPCGLAILREEGRALLVRHMGLGVKFGGAEVCVRTFNQLWHFAVKKGFKELVYRYTGNELGLTEDVLRLAGFRFFKEEDRVYEIDASKLESLLKEGRYAAAMQEQSARLLSEGAVLSFTEAGDESTELFRELYPSPELSFMTRTPEGYPDSSIIISELSDGSLYLADFTFYENKEKDFAGLIYMSLTEVLKRIRPEGLFYIAAVEERFRFFVQRFFAPLDEGMGQQSVYRASRPVE